MSERATINIALAGQGIVPGAQGWAFSHTPLSRGAADDLAHVRLADDAATIMLDDEGTATVAPGVSGAQGVFVRLDTNGSGATLASSPSLLVDAGGAPPTPDWNAWAQIIATGGPLGTGTPFREVRRMMPGDVIVARTGQSVRYEQRRWEWLDEVTEGSADLDDIADALDRRVASLAKASSLHVLLSGGWDSRVLAVLAKRHDPDVQAWTTSKDAGTAWEELRAREVARKIELPHHLMQPDADAFPQDMHAYAETVAYQTSYHVWLTKLAKHLGSEGGTVLDGLGGGVFFGGAFPPTVGVGSADDRRFGQLIRYLRSASGVLRPEVEAQLAERSRNGFDAVVAPLRGHREVDALTAYLTRTLPGISLGPFGLIAAHAPAAAPFLDHEVVTASCAIRVAERKDRSLYPALLRRWNPVAADLPTAMEPPPRRRRRPQRAACLRTAAACRAVLLNHSVGDLLHQDLRRADVGRWQEHLESKADQHILRSLWMLALWLDRYSPSGDGPDVLTRATG